MRDSCGNNESRGDPTGASGQGGPPTEASALHSNQRPNLYKQTVDKFDFLRVCLQSEASIHFGCFLIRKSDDVNSLSNDLADCTVN